MPTIFPTIFRFLTIVLLALTLQISAAQDSFQAHARENTHPSDAVIEKFLLDNPAILLRALENMQSYMKNESERLAQAKVKENAALIYRDSRDYVIGRADAPITIVEFFDYNCGYCKRALPTVREIIKNNTDVRVVFKEMPILGASSVQAAQIALAIERTSKNIEKKNPSKYFAIHQDFFQSKNGLHSAALTEILKNNGLNAARLMKQSQHQEIQKHIDDTLGLAQTLGISGTPAFIIDDTIYPGALSYADLQKIVNRTRDKL